MPTTLSDLVYSVSKPLSEKEFSLFPYTHLAGRASLPNFRTLNLGNMLSDPDLRDMLGKGASRYLNFVSERGRVLVIFNFLLSRPVSFLLVSIPEREKMFGGKGSHFLYGLSSLERDFAYGSPIFIVEGALDAESLRHYCGFRNVLALQTSSLTLPALELVSMLTNRVILIYDNDSGGTGQRQTARDLHSLSTRGVLAHTFEHPRGVKDCGVMADMDFAGNLMELEGLKSHYTLEKKRLEDTFRRALSGRRILRKADLALKSYLEVSSLPEP